MKKTILFVTFIGLTYNAMAAEAAQEDLPLTLATALADFNQAATAYTEALPHEEQKEIINAGYKALSDLAGAAIEIYNNDNYANKEEAKAKWKSASHRLVEITEKFKGTKFMNEMEKVLKIKDLLI